MRDDAEAVECEGIMENGTPLDDILGSENELQIEQSQEGQLRDEQGRFVAPETGEPQETAPQEGPPPSEPEQSHIPIAALKDERAKRQAIEENNRQLAERLQQYDAYFAQQAQGQQQDQDPLEIIAQQVMSRLQPQTEMQMLTMRVDMAEQVARTKWADYDEKVEHFKEAVKSNPFLLQELKASANPAEYAYTAANRILEAKSYGEAGPSREAMEAKIRQELMAELGLDKPQVPTSLVTSQSRGTRAAPAFAGPTPLDQILG
ncbi:hypothetical protein TomTYG75_07120 [Sphingobium sp. TomTYG75]